MLFLPYLYFLFTFQFPRILGSKQNSWHRKTSKKKKLSFCQIVNWAGQMSCKLNIYLSSYICLWFYSWFDTVNWWSQTKPSGSFLVTRSWRSGASVSAATDSVIFLAVVSWQRNIFKFWVKTFKHDKLKTWIQSLFTKSLKLLSPAVGWNNCSQMGPRLTLGHPKVLILYRSRRSVLN